MPHLFNFFTPSFRTLLLLTLAWTASTVALAGKSYSYFAQGSPSAPTSVLPPAKGTQSIALMGGGYDVAEAFRWMIKRSGVQPAKCDTLGCTATTGGRFLVLRATGTDAYNPYVLSRLGTPDATGPYENVGGIDMGLSSVETLIVSSVDAANDPFVADRINAAHAIWIAGGDQSDYVKFWKGTGLNTALKSAITRGIPVGGTSAGMAILGQYSFAALNGTVTSSQALSDPYNKYMTFDPIWTATTTSTSLLDVAVAPLNNTITDTHLDSRNRMGRMVAFLSRMTKPTCSGPAEASKARAIGLDEETALLISYSEKSNPAATANLVSNPVYSKTTNTDIGNPNSAYMLEFSPRNILTSICQSGVPLRITGSPDAFTLVRTTANDVDAKTTACSTTAQLVTACTSLNPLKVSFMSANISFNLSDWSSLCTNKVKTACSTTTNMYPTGGFLSGTTY